MKIVKSASRDFGKIMARLDGRMDYGPSNVFGVVTKIINGVRRSGNKALLAYTKKFDGVELSARSMKVSESRMVTAARKCDPKILDSLNEAAKRIEKFHKKQIEKSWKYRDSAGELGQIITPLEAVGVYVPGGKASYPSSALMNIIPARLAGVERIVMVTPAPNGEINPHTLAAADIAGADEVYTIGGAQAVAALAFGTQTIKPVDKITGPGNVYVAEAKRQVFGKVDIDMIAGPSEILIIADETANPAYIAADLLSQAEHDENAYPILVTPSEELAIEVQAELKAQTKILSRKAIVNKCLRRNCFAFVTGYLYECFDIANRIAPEHLELITRNAKNHINKVRNAGALFIGPWSPEAIGDYCAGPNHVLPTGGTARFSSPLGVYDFVKRTSLISISQKGLPGLARTAMPIAKEEGLEAHARAVEVRLKK